MRVDGYDWAGKRVLVTGASGFQAAFAAAALHRMGAEVIATARHQVNPRSAYVLLDLESKIPIVRDFNLCDFQQVRDVVNTNNPVGIFNFAAVATVPAARLDPRRAVAVNVMGPVNLMEACRGSKSVKGIDIVSTDHVMLNFRSAELPHAGFDEWTPAGQGAPAGPYDSTKAAMEVIIRSMSRTYGGEVPPVMITRSANVFGPGDTAPRRVIPRFISCAKKEKLVPLTYRYNGRQFIWITDAIAGHIKAMSRLMAGSCSDVRLSLPRRPRDPVPTFHFAIENYLDGKPYVTLEELATMIANLYGAVVVDTSCADYAPDENEVQALNCLETRKALGWRPETSLMDGLMKMGLWVDACRSRSEQEQLIHDEVDNLVKAMQLSEAVAA